MDQYTIGGNIVIGVESATKEFKKRFKSEPNNSIAKKVLLYLSLDGNGTFKPHLTRFYNNLREKDGSYSWNHLSNVIENLIDLGFINYSTAKYSVRPIGRAVAIESTKEELGTLREEIKDERFNIKTQEDLVSIITKS